MMLNGRTLPITSLETTWGDRHPIEDVLRKFTYRPGWKFSVFRARTLRIDAYVVDTDDHRRTILVTFEIGLPYPVPMHMDWQEWLFRQVMEVENHEAREFFKIDGAKPYDPHK